MLEKGFVVIFVWRSSSEKGNPFLKSLFSHKNQDQGQQSQLIFTYNSLLHLKLQNESQSADPKMDEKNMDQLKRLKTFKMFTLGKRALQNHSANVNQEGPQQQRDHFLDWFC